MPVGTSTIGIIYPPPEVRSIVDKTATFVARNGPEFEEKIRNNEISNTKFNFLNQSDPYHAYYRHKVKEIAEGKSSVETTTTTTTTNTTPVVDLQKLSLNNNNNNNETQSKLIEQLIVLKEAPSEFEFIADAPSIMPLDIDCIKLTAQFVARNGRPFLNSLSSKEQRNAQFDFLKPQHSHFAYFTRLVEQYTKILLPPKDLVGEMRGDLAAPFDTLKSVQYRCEWQRAKQREKQRQDELAERERIAYAQIDWHDFVTVETVEYQSGEMGNFPLPTTPAHVGARTCAQERMMTTTNGVSDTPLSMASIVEDESRCVVVDKTTATQDTNVDQVAMDEEDSDEDQKTSQQEQEAAAAAAADQKSQKTMPKDFNLPLPPNPDNVIIRRDYDPKNKAASSSSSSSSSQQQQQYQSHLSSSGGGGGGEQYFKSPLTGELIAASSMSEHMRISMLDPRWIEQRQKEKREREDHEEVLVASGASIQKNLKRMAEYRSDMFGSGVEEATIGHKLMQDHHHQQQQQQHAANNNNNIVNRSQGITIEEQIKAIHQSQGLAQSVESHFDDSKIGPSIPRSAMQQQQQQQQQQQPPPPQQQQQTIMLSNYKLLNVPPGSIKQPMMQQLQQQQQHSLVPPPSSSSSSSSILQVTEDEPLAKRLKTAEEQLLPEDEFMRLHSSKGPCNFVVQVPNVAEKPEWNLNGQTIVFAMELTEMVSSIKSKLNEMLSMPTAKQKLQLDSMFIKDTNTLAFYNFTADSIVHLQLKERGGRKK
jgi:splicing factor 3A subunit 1